MATRKQSQTRKSTMAGGKRDSKKPTGKATSTDARRARGILRYFAPAGTSGAYVAKKRKK